MRLLVIDTENSFPEPFIRGFTQSGFLTDKTNGVGKGEWMAKTNHYDVIILNLKNIDSACSVTKKISANLPEEFLIVFSQCGYLEKRMALYEAGADEVVAQTCSFREVLLRIKVLLKREKRKVKIKKDNILCVDNLFMDLENYRVFRENNEIILRKKEFDLLFFLACNQGKILTKTFILEGVWGADVDFFTNTLETHILSLRKKIDNECPPKKRLIHTIHGRGYLFGLNPCFSVSIPSMPARVSLVSK